LHVSGQIHRRNRQLWVEEQSNGTYDQHRDTSQVQVQLSITQTKIYGTIMFAQGTVCGKKYPDMLQQFTETQLRNDGISDTVAFQQDRAPVHSVNAVQENLYNSFRDRWRGTASRLWAKCSPDFMHVHLILLRVLSKLEGTKQNLITFMNYKSVFMMQLRELHQQCYIKYSEQSWNIGNIALKWTQQP